MLGAGHIVGGRYRLGKSLGEGGAAQVFEAWDETLERMVAVKLLFPADQGQKGELIARFLREAKISAAVQHQHVISIVDFGTTDDATPYMVMELLQGLSLADRLQAEVVISALEAIEFGILILRGLGAVHRAAIVHSDLKPENIFLVRDGDGYLPKILDFGISLSIDPESRRRSVHDGKDGKLVGTPDYMSPEQVRGLTDIDTRTDIYSLGVILYECVVGRMPFEADEIDDLLNLIAIGNAPDANSIAPWVPDLLSRVIVRAMAAKREDRYQSTEKMLEAMVQVGMKLNQVNGVDVTAPFKVIRSTVPPASRSPAEIDAIADSVNLYHSESRRLASNAAAAAPRHTPSPVLWVIVGVGVFFLALAGAMLVGSPGETDHRPQAVAARPETQGERAASDEVRLDNLPPGATVRLDGVVTTHPIVIVRDGAPHVIEVTHPDYERWRVTHVAAGAADYFVQAPAHEAGSAEAAGAGDLAEGANSDSEDERRAARRARRRALMVQAEGNQNDEPGESGESEGAGAEEPTGPRPRTFRMLDY